MGFQIKIESRLHVAAAAVADVAGNLRSRPGYQNRKIISEAKKILFSYRRPIAFFSTLYFQKVGQSLFHSTPYFYKQSTSKQRRVCLS